MLHRGVVNAVPLRFKGNSPPFTAVTRLASGLLTKRLRRRVSRTHIAVAHTALSPNKPLS